MARSVPYAPVLARRRGVIQQRGPIVPERRLPKRAQGIAASGQEGGDFTLPMCLHRDAVLFYEIAERSAALRRPGSIEATERYSRAAIVASFASLEAQLNQTAFVRENVHGESLEQIVRDVLTEQETTIDGDGRIVRRTRYWSLTARLSFITAFLSGQTSVRRSTFETAVCIPSRPFPSMRSRHRQRDTQSPLLVPFSLRCHG
jgi:hypothetical protein